MAHYIIIFMLAVLVPTVPANPLDDVCQRQVQSKLTDIKSKLTEIKSIRAETATLVRNCESTAFEDCCQIKEFNESSTSGLFKIHDPCGTFNSEMDVYCDMETDGGGWVIIQRRLPTATVNFTRNWEDYENGFGDLEGEFWLGLKTIHELTTKVDVELMTTVRNESGPIITWTYQVFRVSGPDTYYVLNISGGQGPGYDAMAYNNGQRFSTYDSGYTRCAYQLQGGWWYQNCHTYANLNGPHVRPNLPGVHKTNGRLHWNNGVGGHKYYTNAEMKIRPKSCQSCSVNN